MTSTAATSPSAEVQQALARVTGHVVPARSWTAVTGGVSSEVWRVDTGSVHGIVCVKRPLAQLRVTGDWRVPLERAQWEARWLAESARRVPGRVPTPWGFDPATLSLVLPWLDPGRYPVWKHDLLTGTVDVAVSARVGSTLAALHGSLVAEARTGGWREAKPFFRQLRIEPYFDAVARTHPEVGSVMRDLAEHLHQSATTIIHGDFSPKNILIGDDGPVVLDAECASPGDAAFDLAFVLNHLLLKATHLASAASTLHTSATALLAAYLDLVHWEDPAELSRRAASQMAALALARVDGLSPVEYLSPAQQNLVRQIALELLTSPPADAHQAVARWIDYLEVGNDTHDR